MSEPIKVGDLVQVVRWLHKHGSGKLLGRVYTVAAFGPLCICATCQETLGAAVYMVEKDEWPSAPLPLPYLKRIPPLPELDDVRQDEEIHA